MKARSTGEGYVKSISSPRRVLYDSGQGEKGVHGPQRL